MRPIADVTKRLRSLTGIARCVDAGQQDEKHHSLPARAHGCNLGHLRRVPFVCRGLHLWNATSAPRWVLLIESGLCQDSPRQDDSQDDLGPDDLGRTAPEGL